MADTPQLPVIKIESLIVNPTVPKLYANGFTIAFSHADANIVFLLNNIPIGVLHMSIESAKTLQTILTTTIEGFEEQTGFKFKNIFELDESMKKNKKNE